MLLSAGQRLQSDRILFVFVNACREHSENVERKILHLPIILIAKRDFPREFPSFVASVATNYKRILFFMSHFSVWYKKLIFPELFRTISSHIVYIVLGKSLGYLVICYLNIAIWTWRAKIYTTWKILDIREVSISINLKQLERHT